MRNHKIKGFANLNESEMMTIDGGNTPVSTGPVAHLRIVQKLVNGILQTILR